jgi:hypothetical protein
MGQVYLAPGKSVSMRLWREAPGGSPEETARDDETVGDVIQGGRARPRGAAHRPDAPRLLVVPKGATHRNRILEDVLGVEATAPPSQVHGRDVGHS